MVPIIDRGEVSGLAVPNDLMHWVCNPRLHLRIDVFNSIINYSAKHHRFSVSLSFDNWTWRGSIANLIDMRTVGVGPQIRRRFSWFQKVDASTATVNEEASRL